MLFRSALNGAVFIAVDAELLEVLIYVALIFYE